MEIYSELLKQYEQEKLKMVNGEEVNKLELMFIGYTLDAVDTAKRNFLLSKVYRRITNGSEDNVYHFYQVIKKDIEGTSDLIEATIDDLKEKRKGNWIKRLFGR